MADGTGAITLPWGDEEYTFRLGIDQWRKIEDPKVCNAGGTVIAQRLLAVAAVISQGVSLRRAIQLGLIKGEGPRADDIRAPILWALVGGGMSEVAAARLVRERVDGQPYEANGNLALAYAIVMAGICGPEDDPVEIDEPGEQPGEGTVAPLSPTADIDGPQSSAPARRSGGRRRTSVAAPSGSSPSPSPATEPRTARPRTARPPTKNSKTPKAGE